MKQILFLSFIIFFSFFIKDVELDDNQPGNDSNTMCTLPYHPVGDYCLLIDDKIQGNWNQLRSVCLALEGDLVSLKDANILYEINQYIIEEGMDGKSFWVGANDLTKEGMWVWSVDNSSVKMEAPLWGRLYGDQPNGDQDQNCGVLWAPDFHYLHDEDCANSMSGVICQPRNSGESKSSVPVPPNDCPPEYQNIGNSCFKILVKYDYTWAEAVEFCSGTKTHLAKIDDANLFGELYDHLQQVTDAYFFWIGGSDEELEDTWLWENDGSPIKRGTPYWDVNTEGDQEPDSGTAHNCVYLNYADLYRFRDNSCSGSYGIICQYDTT